MDCKFNNSTSSIKWNIEICDWKSVAKTLTKNPSEHLSKVLKFATEKSVTNSKFIYLRPILWLQNRSQILTPLKSKIPKSEAFCHSFHLSSSFSFPNLSPSPTSLYHLHHSIVTAVVVTVQLRCRCLKGGYPPSWFSSTLSLVPLFFCCYLQIYFFKK